MVILATPNTVGLRESRRIVGDVVLTEDDMRARREWPDTIGYGYRQMGESGYAWPVIDMHIRYIAPCRFQQWISVQASIVEWEHRLRIHYLIRDRDSGARLCRGRTDQVAVDMSSQEMCLASPPVLFTKLGLAST